MPNTMAHHLPAKAHPIPPAVIGLSRPTPPVYTLCLTFCGMEYPKDQLRSPALAMALPAPHAPPHWQSTRN